MALNISRMETGILRLAKMRSEGTTDGNLKMQKVNKTDLKIIFQKCKMEGALTCPRMGHGGSAKGRTVPALSLEGMGGERAENAIIVLEWKLETIKGQ